MNKVAFYKEEIVKSAGNIQHAIQDEMAKEAGLVKAVGAGVKRAGQLVTGSKSKALGKELNQLASKGGTGFKESVYTGNKMSAVQGALSKEQANVKKTRTALGVAGATGAVGASAMKNNSGQEKIASYIDAIYKEAGLVSHASKAVTGLTKAVKPMASKVMGSKPMAAAKPMIGKAVGEVKGLEKGTKIGLASTGVSMGVGAMGGSAQKKKIDEMHNAMTQNGVK